MITLNLERHSDGEMRSHSTRQETVQDALSFLVRSELAFGAQVIDMTAESIHLETHLSGIVDVTYLTGSAQDMQQLVDTVAFYLAACERDSLVYGGASSDFLRLTGGQAAYSGVILNLGAPIFVGRSRVRIAVMLALGYREEADLQLAASVSLEDLMTLIGMLDEYPGQTLRTLGEQLGYSITVEA